jgi:Spy/CpxP family protein refolding chaperone
MTLTGRSGTVVVVALIASLCVNLLLAGVMLGDRWHGGSSRHHMFLSNIPEDARPVVKGVFESHRTEFDSHRDAIQQARLKVAELLKAEPIDQAQLDQAVGELMRQSQAMQQFGYQVMVEVARKLPPEVRREMADRWAKDRFRKKPDSD